MDKKGQSGGLVTGLVFGIVSLVIGVIIAFVLVSTLTGSNLLPQDSITVLNEQYGYANNTGYTFSGMGYVGAEGFTITSASNSSADTPIVLANFTISSGVVKNATKIAWSNVTFNYTYTRDSREIQITNSLSGNFSEGVNNISSKIPTLLLIAAIVLIIGILAVLVGVWQKMKMGGGNL